MNNRSEMDAGPSEYEEHINPGNYDEEGFEYEEYEQEYEDSVFDNGGPMITAMDDGGDAFFEGYEGPTTALPRAVVEEPAGMPQPARLDEYDRDYPDRDDPDIQSLIAAKSEFAECRSGPNPMKDIRVDPRFFNNQVYYQRIMSAYGSCACFFEMGSGKTGSIECFRAYTEQFRPGTVSWYWYITNEAQQLEFKYQITENFATEKVRANFTAVSAKTTLNYLQVERDQKKIAKDYFKEKMIDTLTYLAMSALIDSMDNELLIKTFGNASVSVDEVQFIKITEGVDNCVTPRPSRPVAGVRYERQRMKVYKSFWRLTHVCPDCKFVVMTGRPMTRDYNELLYILNLLPKTTQIDTPLARRIAESMAALPADRRVPMPTKWAKVDLAGPHRAEQLELVARGRIMYIRAPETGAYKTYDQSTSLRTVEKFAELGRTVTLVVMHAFQARTYLRAHTTMMTSRNRKAPREHTGAKLRGEQDTLHHTVLQGMIFAIPTEEYMNRRMNGETYESIPDSVRHGGIGKEYLDRVADRHIEKYAITLTTDRYRKMKIQRGDNMIREHTVWTPRATFNRFVRSDLLFELSAKFFDLLQQLDSGLEGMVYVASQYDTTAGGILSWILDARGYQRFQPVGKEWVSATGHLLIDKVRRYASITSTNPDEHQGILSLARHPGNWKGEYLTLIVSSPVGTVGINVGNSWRVCILNPLSSDAAMDQATARVMRPNAHKEILRHLGLERFGVKFVFYIAEMPPGLPEMAGNTDLATIEWSMYHSLYASGRGIARIARDVKRISVDFPANIDRNVRPDDEPGSPEVDYLPTTRYGPYHTFRRLPLDTTTYDAYYARHSLSKVVSSLTEVISSVNFSAVNIATVLNLLSTQLGAVYSRSEMLLGIRHIVENRLSIGKSRLGFSAFLEEDQGTLYSTTSLNRESDKMLSYYYPLNTVLQDTLLERQAYDLMQPTAFDSLIAALREDPMDQLRVRLLSVSSLMKGKLFEMASTEYSDETWAQKLMEALYALWVRVGDDVIVHQITNLFFKGSNFDAVEFVLKANTNLRIFAHGEWRWCNPGETETYSVLLNAKIEGEMQPYYDKFASAGFIGLIIRPDDIHIRNVVTNTVTGAHSGDRGKRMSGFSAQDLVGMLYDMGCVSVQHYTMKRAQMYKSIRSAFKRISTVLLDSFTDDKIAFFYQKSLELQGRNNKVSRTSVELCECMASKGAIFALVGTVLNTLGRLNADTSIFDTEDEEGELYDFDTDD